MKVLFAILASLMIASSAHAARFALPSGNYGDGRFEFAHLGDMLQLFDTKREITYEIRFDRPGVEQPLPPEFYEASRYQNDARRNRRFIKSLAFINPVINDTAGKSLSAEGRGTFRVASAFGDVELDFKSLIEIKVDTCRTWKNWWSRNVPCAKLSVSEVSLTGLRSSSLPAALVQPVGLILDVALQIGMSSAHRQGLRADLVKVPDSMETEEDSAVAME